MGHVKKFKKMIIFVMALAVAFSSLSVSAAVKFKIAGKSRTYSSKKYAVYYDGKKISTSSRYAVLYNGNYMIPYKLLANKGPKLKSDYDSKKKKLTMNDGKTKIVFTLNKKKMRVNGVKKSLRTPALQLKIGGKKDIFVPAKAYFEAIGVKYTPNSHKKRINIPRIPTALPKSEPDSLDSGNISVALQATAFKGMSPSKFIAALAPIVQEDARKSGILASVTLSQAILESGWGKSELAQKGNNLFGMKTSLSGNTWPGSAWDGKSHVTMKTKEEERGKTITITASFRKYSNVGQSIADHSAYLCNARNGSSKRYVGLTATKSYARQLNILKNGGYCTGSTYVNQLTNLIKQYNLTKYD